MLTATEAISQGRQAGNDGKFAVARAHYAEVAKIYRDQNDVLAYAHIIRHIADIYRQESNLVEAKPLYEESLELYRGNLWYKNSRPREHSQTIRASERRTRKSGTGKKALGRS